MEPYNDEKLKQTQEFLRTVAGKESYAHLQAVDEDLSEDDGEVGEMHPCIGASCATEDPSAYRCRYHYFG